MSAQALLEENLKNIDFSKRKEIAVARLAEQLEVMLPKQKAYIEKSVPLSNQRVFADSFSGSKAKAIKAKCLSCCNFSKDDITHCTVLICPLHTVRPYQSKSANDSEDED